MNLIFAWISKNWLSLAIVLLSLLSLLVAIFKLRRNRNRKKEIDFSICCGNSISHSKIQSLRKEEEWHRLIQKEMAQLVDGVILFNPPSIMRVGVTERIETRISKEIYANLRKSLKGAGFP